MNGGGTALGIQYQSFYTLYDFDGGAFEGPYASLAADSDDELYGTTNSEGPNHCNQGYGDGCGSIFKVTRDQFISLHDFTGGSDGAVPYSTVTIMEGKLYGAASTGGSQNCGWGCGVVWQITP